VSTNDSKRGSKTETWELVDELPNFDGTFQAPVVVGEVQRPVGYRPTRTREYVRDWPGSGPWERPKKP
jgi:hypothetical protein